MRTRPGDEMHWNYENTSITCAKWYHISGEGRNRILWNGVYEKWGWAMFANMNYEPYWHYAKDCPHA